MVTCVRIFLSVQTKTLEVLLFHSYKRVFLLLDTRQLQDKAGLLLRQTLLRGRTTSGVQTLPTSAEQESVTSSTPPRPSP